jgi:HEAT repeat protein
LPAREQEREGNMPRVFISYVRDNSELLKRLAHTLHVSGIDVWLDRDQIKSGERWAEMICQGIEQGDFFIVCFSSAYNKHLKTDMPEELTAAMEALRQRLSERTWFIPVLVSKGELPNWSLGTGEPLPVLEGVALDEDWDRGIQRILSLVKPPAERLDELIHALSNPSAPVRIRAADELGKRGQAAQEAIPALTKALEDPNETLRAHAAQALGAIGLSTKDMVLKLLATLWEERPGEEGPQRILRGDTLKRIAQLGEAAIPALVDALGSDKWRMRQGAVLSLRQIGGAAVPALIEILRQQQGARDEEGRYLAALETLGQIGASAKDAVPLLIEAVETKSALVGAAAMRALAGIGKEAQAATPLLIEQLNYYREERKAKKKQAKKEKQASRPYTRTYRTIRDAQAAEDAAQAAVYALGMIGDPSAVAPLIAASSDEELCIHAIDALKGIGAEKEIIIPALIAVLSDEKKDYLFREYTAFRLGRRGNLAAPAVPVLLKILQRRPPILQSRSTRHEADVLRAAAASALGEIGEAAGPAIPALIKALKHADEWVCRDAAQALGKMGEPAQVAIPALKRALNHPSEYVLVAVAGALHALGEPPRAAIPRLIAMLDAQDWGLGAAAALQLGKLGRAAQAATPKLQAMLANKHQYVRTAAAEALAKIGP